MGCNKNKRFLGTLIAMVTILVTISFADETFDKLFSSGKYKEAIDYADEKIPVAERNAVIWAKLGIANEEEKMIEKALACYMVSLRLDQNNYEASLGASRVYYKMGQFDKAKEMAEKAMKIKMSGEASWAYAQACIALNKPNEAKSALEKVVESDPTNVVAQKALGNVYYKEKNCSKALPYLKKSYSSQPDGEIALMLANCFKTLGNLDSAEIFYKEASRDRKSPQPEASLELARIYFKKEKYDDVVEEYGKIDKNLLTGQDFYNYGISIDKINGNREKMIEAFELAAKRFGNAATPEMLIAKEKSGRYFLETKRYREALEALEFIRKNIGDTKINPEILFLIADAHQGLNQRQNAISILESVIAKDPKNVEAYARLADLYTKENQADKAKGIYEKLLSLQPNNPEVFLALGQYNLKSQKYEEALKNFQKAFTLGQKAEAAVGMMKAAWELKKYDIARDAAESALNKDEKLREPQLILAKILFMDKDYVNAASKVEDLLKGDPKNLELLQLLADCYEKLNKKDKLADIDQKILELDKKNMKSGLRLANYYREGGNNKAAAEILRDLLIIQPKNADIIKSLYEVSLKNGDKKAALEYLSDYLKIRPNDANLQKEYGDMLYEQKDKEGALNAYRAAIKADPSIKGLYKRYAELIMTRKGATKEEEKEMVDVLTAAVKAGEADAEIYSTLGSIYKKQGAFPMAIEMYQKALQKDPKDIESMSGLAYCQEKAGKFSDAIISYEQVIAMNPQSVKEYKSVGELYLKTGRKEQAISAFKKYLEKASDEEIALQVGDFEYEKNNFSEAAKYYAMVKGPKAADSVFLQRYSDAAYKSGDMKKAEELLTKLTAINPKAPEPFLKLYEITLKADKKGLAAQYLQKYTDLRPTDATSLQKLGDLYYELKNDSAAIVAYKNLLKVNPKAKGFYKKYIELIDKRGTQEEKLSVYTNAVAAGEADATVYLFLGRASMKGGNYPKALQYFEKATQLAPNNIAAMKSLAECQKYTGNISGAILSYEQVVALDPKAEEEYKELGELYTKQNKIDNAISAYKKYLEKRPDDSISIVVGDAAVKKGNYAEAISYYERVKGKDSQTEQFLLKYGDACLQAKKDDRAIEIYRKLTIINPQNPKIFKTLFDLLYKNDKKDDAIVYLKKYTELNPKDAEALKDLGDMLHARGDKSGAINAYQMAVKANPSIKGFYKKYADLVIEKGSEEEIVNVLAGAVAANEADVEIYKRLGSIYLKRKLYDKAIPLFEKASQLEPQNTQVLKNLADAQANVGNINAAVLTYEQVVALNPKAVEEYKILGDLYKKQNKIELAIKNYKKYLESRSDNTVAREVAEYLMGKKEYGEAVKYFDMITGADANSPDLLRKHADAAQLAGDNNKAFSLYKKLSTLQPQNAEVLKKIYQMAEKIKAEDDLLFYLKKYTAVNPNDDEAQIKLGNILCEKKDSLGALIAYRAAFKANPKSRGYLKQFATIVMSQGKEEEIISVLNAAIEANEATVPIYLKLGSIYLDKKNYPLAISMFEKASKLDPSNATILSQLAKAQVAQGDISGAILSYEQVVALKPDAEAELKELGDLYWKQKKNEQAIKVYIKYLDKRPDNEIAKLVGSEMYNRKQYKEAVKYLSMVTGAEATQPKHLMLYGLAALNANDDYKAYQIFKQLANITPQDPVVFENLYTLAQKVGTKDDVLNYLRTLTTLKPNDAKAQKTLAEMLLDKKDEVGALNAYRAAVKADSSIRGIYKNYGNLVIVRGTDAEKEIVLKKAVAYGEADAKMYAELGEIYSKKGMYAEAISAYEKASQLDPSNDRLLSAMAYNQVKKGAISEAIGTYEQVIALNPRAEKELKLLGDLYLQQKRDSLAINCYRKYLDKNPNDAEVAFTVGELLFKAKKFADAMKYFAMVKGEIENKPSFLRMYGDVAYETKDYTRAHIQYSRLVKLAPQDASVYKRLYEINIQSGAKIDAMNNLQMYTKLVTNDADAFKSLGDLLYEQGKKEEALSAYKKALSINPKIKGIYKNYVPLILTYGKPAEKIEALNGAIAAKEADVVVYKNLGEIYANAKNYTKAIEMYKEAVKLDQNDARLYLNYSDCLINTGDLVNAAEILEKALKLNPAATKEYKLLGDLKLKQKKEGEAVEAYVKYLEKTPTDEEIAKVVADYYYKQKKYSDAYRYYSMIKRNVTTSMLVPYGISALKSQDYNAAITILEKVRGATKENIPDRDVAYKSLAEAYEKSGSPRKAAEVLFDYVKLPGVNDPDAAYRIAVVYESIDMNQALQMYKNNISNYPKDYRNYLKLGMYYAKEKGNEKTAAAYLEKSIALNDSQPEVLLTLGGIYNRLNKNDDMLRVYRKLIEVAPQNVDAMIKIGELLLNKKLASDAIIFLEMANAAEENNPKTLTLLARANLMNGDQREGAKLIEKVIKLTKGNIDDDLRLTLADVYIANGEHAKAANELKELMKTNTSTKVMMKYAEALLASGKAADALKIAEQIKAKEPENIEVMMMIGKIKVSLKKYNEAIETYKEILYIDQNYAPALCERANVYLLQGKLQWAETFYERALKADPNNAMVYLGLARLAKEKKDYASYTEYIEKARKLDPQNKEIQAELRSTR